jgi:hypothetical protein
MEARQRIMERIGKDGCYFLCLVRLAEEIIGDRIDAIDVYLFAVDRQWMDQDCFMVQPNRVLEHMTGVRWSVRKQDKTYQTQPGEKEVLRYERTQGRVTYAHFVLPDYDPYGDSLTVRNGRLVSKRIFARV